MSSLQINQNSGASSSSASGPSFLGTPVPVPVPVPAAPLQAQLPPSGNLMQAQNIVWPANPFAPLFQQFQPGFFPQFGLPGLGLPFGMSPPGPMFPQPMSLFGAPSSAPFNVGNPPPLPAVLQNSPAAQPSPATGAHAATPPQPMTLTARVAAAASAAVTENTHERAQIALEQLLDRLDSGDSTVTAVTLRQALDAYLQSRQRSTPMIPRLVSVGTIALYFAKTVDGNQRPLNAEDALVHAGEGSHHLVRPRAIATTADVRNGRIDAPTIAATKDLVVLCSRIQQGTGNVRADELRDALTKFLLRHDKHHVVPRVIQSPGSLIALFLKTVGPDGQPLTLEAAKGIANEDCPPLREARLHTLRMKKERADQYQAYCTIMGINPANAPATEAGGFPSSETLAAKASALVAQGQISAEEAADLLEKAQKFIDPAHGSTQADHASDATRKRRAG